MDLSLVEIIENKYRDNSGRLFYHTYIYLPDNRDLIYELLLKLVGVSNSDVVTFKFLPGAQIGFLKYYCDHYNKRIIDTSYFNIIIWGNRTQIDVDSLPQWLTHHGKTNRLQFLDRIINCDKIKSREDIYELFGYQNRKQIDNDINTITEWNKLREDIVKMIATRGFHTSTEIASIMDIDERPLLKILKKLRKDNVIPESKYSHNKKSK